MCNVRVWKELIYEWIYEQKMIKLVRSRESKGEDMFISVWEIWEY